MLYEECVKSVASELGMSVSRVDERLDHGPVMEAIWSDIANCKVVIADCTAFNPNVYYELGIAHTLGKTTITVIEKGMKVPFDVAALRYIELEADDEGFAKFRKTLIRALDDKKLRDSGSDLPGADG